jgi:hypothetical protein
MKLNDRMANVEASLDDLQSGMEATFRAANAIHIDTTKFNGCLGAPLLRAVLRHVKNLLSCARDQRAAMQELRTSLGRLREQLNVDRRAISRQPSSSNAIPQWPH